MLWLAVALGEVGKVVAGVLRLLALSPKTRELLRAERQRWLRRRLVPAIGDG